MVIEGSQHARVVFLRPLFHPVAEEVLTDAGADVVNAWQLPPDERDEEIARADALIGSVNGEELARATRVRVIATGASGYDTTPIDVATERGIAIVNAAGLHHIALAEHGIGIMLALARRISYCDRIAHTESRGVERTDLMGEGWPGWPTQLHGKTIGLVGFGFIGRELAAKCQAAFSMRVLAFDPYFDPSTAPRVDVTIVQSLDALLPECDYVSLQLPLTQESRGLIDTAAFGSMKQGAVLVNLSRGPTVDTEALVASLRSGHLSGAALDVTDPEPLPAGHPLYGFDNVVLTPHIAGWTVESVENVAATTARDVLKVLRGEHTPRVVNPEVLPESVS